MTYQDILHNLTREGYCALPPMLDPAAARSLFDTVLAGRPFDKSIFLSEAEWEASTKSHRHTNPGLGFNALEKLTDKLSFIDANAQVGQLFTQLLGPGYRVLSKKLICRLPWSRVPDWLRERRYGKPNNALGAFIHPQYRDISYYLDVDLHQDIQDHNRFPMEYREPRFFTYYVYLDEVTQADAPIQLMPGTHRFGATQFQHDVTYQPDGSWLYRDGGRSMTTSLETLTGPAGFAGMWHSCLLHGTPPVGEGHFRLSLRYIVARSPDPAPCGVDSINTQVEGPLYQEKDFTPGANAGADGFWNMKATDYIRYSYGQL